MLDADADIDVDTNLTVLKQIQTSPLPPVINADAGMRR